VAARGLHDDAICRMARSLEVNNSLTLLNLTGNTAITCQGATALGI